MNMVVKLKTLQMFLFRKNIINIYSKGISEDLNSKKKTLKKLFY